MDKPVYKISERLKEGMGIRNLRAVDLVDKTGIPKSTISQYLSEYAKPKSDRVYLLANALNVSPSWLLGYDVPMQSQLVAGKKIPILGDIACGKPILAESNIIDFTVVSENERVDFALIAQGNSMNNARIESGDTVFIRQQPIVENGEIALVLIDNEATIKRFFDYPDKVVLTPDSKDTSYKPMIYNKKDCEIRVQGKIIFTKAIIR